MNELLTTLLQEADELKEELASIRRDLHKHPELGWLEMRTSSLVARRLKELGLDEVLVGRQVCPAEARMGMPSAEELAAAYRKAEEEGGDPEYLPLTEGGFTGVVGILRCGEGPVIGLRFDMDALPIQEDKLDTHFPYKNGFASVHDGVMHACGHDGHTTIGLGVAKLLVKHRDQLKGTIKLLFQPAEEGVRGARAMVEGGHLEDVDYLIGSHMGGAAAVSGNMIGVGPCRTLATSKLNACFIGKPAHAGLAPQDGKNALLAAATAILNLQAIPHYGSNVTQVNVGKLTAGVGRNVICDRAVLEMEVRGDSTAANDYMEAYAKRILKAAAEMHDCGLEIEMMGAAACNDNSPELIELAKELLTAAGLSWVPTGDKAGASEDYSCMSDRVQKRGGQALYISNIECCPGIFHSHAFDFDESALCYGVKAFMTLILGIQTK